MDMNLGGKGAKVVVGRELHSAPMGLAGCCIGANTTIGLGVSVAAGRKVPSNLTVIANPEGTLLRIPDKVEGICFVKEGTLCSS